MPVHVQVPSTRRGSIEHKLQMAIYKRKLRKGNPLVPLSTVTRVFKKEERRISTYGEIIHPRRYSYHLSQADALSVDEHPGHWHGHHCP